MICQAKILNEIVIVFPFIASVVAPQFDNETVTGKNLLRLKHYQFGHIYEYSKCKPSVISNMFRLSLYQFHLLSLLILIVCIALFTYELHQQLGLIDKSRHVSVM